MSRISYSDDEDYPGQFDLWRGNLIRSLRGKKGQQALRDLQAALAWMPHKRLIERHLVKDGEFCATGALLAYRVQRADPTLSLGEAARKIEVYVKPTCAQCGCIYAAHVDGACTDCNGRINRNREYRARFTAKNAEGEPYQFSLGPDLLDSICQAYVEPEWVGDPDEEGVAEEVAGRFGVPRMVAWAIVEQNDDPGEWHRDMTPEQRFDHLVKWVEHNLSEDVVRGPVETR